MLTEPLQIGQDIAIKYPGYPILYKIEAVKHITPGGQYVLENHERYTRDGLEMMKDRGKRSRKQLLPITPEIREAVRRDQAIWELSHILRDNERGDNEREKLTTDQIATMALIARFPAIHFELLADPLHPHMAVHLRRVSLRRAPAAVRKGRDFVWRLECGMMHMDKQGVWQIYSMNSRSNDSAFIDSFFYDTPEEAVNAFDLCGGPKWDEPDEE